jgi:hypothetical protein
MFKPGQKIICVDVRRILKPHPLIKDKVYTVRTLHHSGDSIFLEEFNVGHFWNWRFRAVDWIDTLENTLKDEKYSTICE